MAKIEQPELPEVVQTVAQNTEPTRQLVAQEPSIGQLMQYAIDQLGGEGAAQAVEALEKLVALKERTEDRQAKQDFTAALAAFQSECPVISLNKTASVRMKAGGSYSYKYATLDEIAKTIGPILQRHGLSYRWDSDQTDQGVMVTCHLTHVGGHGCSASMRVKTDDKAVVTASQKDGITMSYGKRYTLIMVTGVIVGDPDTDGADPTPITEEQVATLETLLSEIGADVPKFKEYMGVAKLSEITAVDFPAAMTAIEQKRRGR